MHILVFPKVNWTVLEHFDLYLKWIANAADVFMYYVCIWWRRCKLFDVKGRAVDLWKLVENETYVALGSEKFMFMCEIMRDELYWQNQLQTLFIRLQGMVSRQNTCLNSVFRLPVLTTDHTYDPYIFIVLQLRLARCDQLAFANTAPYIWNLLPPVLKDHNLSLAVVKCRLKS